MYVQLASAEKMLGCDDATLRYLSDRKRCLGTKKRGRPKVTSNFNDMTHGSFDVVLHPIKTRILQHIKLQFVPQREHNLR
jgi:hypothetical protein